MHSHDPFSNNPFKNNVFDNAKFDTPPPAKTTSSHCTHQTSPNHSQVSTNALGQSNNPPSQEHILESNIKNMERYLKNRKLNAEIKKQEQHDHIEYSKVCSLKALAQIEIRPLPSKYDNLPSVPLDAFQGNASKFIKIVSSRLNVSPDLIAANFLGILSIAARGKLCVKRTNEHSEQINLFLITLLSSGNMKSSVQKIFTDLIREYENKLLPQIEVQNKRRDIERRMIRKQILKLEKKDPTEEVINKIMALEDKTPSLLPKPDYLAFKGTPEGFEKQMMEQEGAIGIVGSEAGLIKSLSTNKDDLLLLGADGETYDNRKVKKPVRIIRPSVSILLAAQPEAITDFLKNIKFQTDGLHGRFLFVAPTNTPDINIPSTIPKEVVHWLRRQLEQILELPHRKEPYTLTLNEAAHSCWKDYHRKISEEYRKEQYNAAISSFYRKLAGTALRIAGLLHLLSEAPLSNRISEATINSSIQLAEFFKAHTTEVLNLEATTDTKLLQKTLKFLADQRKPEVSVRDIQRALHCRKDELTPILNLLERHHFFNFFELGKSRSCILHPDLKTFLLNNM